jgi:uncharacterized RDD family membrane protein YckC
MKTSTKLSLALVLSLLWIAATVFAVGVGHIIIDGFIIGFMCAVPFISFFMILVVYHLEFLAEQESYDAEYNDNHYK